MNILETLVVLALIMGCFGVFYATLNLALFIVDTVYEIADRIEYIREERKQRRRNEVEK